MNCYMMGYIPRAAYPFSALAGTKAPFESGGSFREVSVHFYYPESNKSENNCRKNKARDIYFR